VCDRGNRRAGVEGREMHNSLVIIAAPKTQIPQQTVVALIIVSALFVFGLLILLGMFVRRADNPAAYGSFFVVALGIVVVLIGFLVTFPLVISGVFNDPTQVLALMTALFGTVAGLVGTYFGVKASSDARQGLQEQVRQTLPGGGTPPPGGGAPPEGTPPPPEGGALPPEGAPPPATLKVDGIGGGFLEGERDRSSH
jgi:hypothetical protein